MAGCLTPDVIAATLAELGEPAYRARQVYEALTRGLVTDFAAVTTLPLALRQALAERLSPLSLTEVETRAAPRGTARKTLFTTADGHPVEAVLMLVAGPGHRLRLHPGRLRRGLRLLRLGDGWGCAGT